MQRSDISALNLIVERAMTGVDPKKEITLSGLSQEPSKGQHEYGPVDDSDGGWLILAYEGGRDEQVEQVIYYQTWPDGDDEGFHATSIADWLTQKPEAMEVINDYTAGKAALGGKQIVLNAETMKQYGLDDPSKYMVVDLGGENGIIVYGAYSVVWSVDGVVDDIDKQGTMEEIEECIDSYKSDGIVIDLAEASGLPQ